MKIRLFILFAVILIGTVIFSACEPAAPSPSFGTGSTSPAVVLGKWHTISTGNEVLDLLVNGNEVWAATTGGVVCWNATEGTFKRYTTLDGLASNTAREIIQDAKGSIWVASSVDGVSRFDGSKWQTFTEEDGLVSNDVITITPDDDGDIWVSGYWGVSRYDGKGWESYKKDALDAVDVIFADSRGNVWFSNRHDGITRYSNGNWETFTQDDGMGLGGARAYLEDEAGNIWVGCMSDVSRFDGEKWTNFHISDQIPRPYVQNIIQDSNGDIWVIAYENVVARYDSITWHNYTMEDGLPASTVNLLFKDKNGSICAVTKNGLSRYESGEWWPFADKEMFTGEVRTVDKDAKGDLWLGTLEGVIRFDGIAWQKFVTEDGLPDNSVTALAEDSRNVMWFGTQDGSVSCYGNLGWKTYGVGEVGAGEYIFSLLADSCNDMWVVGRSGVSRYDGVEWKTVAGAVSFINDRLTPLFEDSSGGVWLNMTDGVSLFDGSNWNIPDELKNFSATDIAEDSEENLWFAGDKICRFDGTDWLGFSTAETVYSILLGKEGDVWFVTKDRHVLHYSNEKQLIEPVPDELPFQPWLGGTLLDSKGNLWMATFYTQSGGLNRYDGDKWQTFTPEDGLAGYQVSTLLEDKEENIWAITNKGVSYFDGAEWHTFTTEDGLASNSVNCLMEDSEGNIWFGTHGGVSYYSK